MTTIDNNVNRRQKPQIESRTPEQDENLSHSEENQPQQAQKEEPLECQYTEHTQQTETRTGSPNIHEYWEQDFSNLTMQHSIHKQSLPQYFSSQPRLTTFNYKKPTGQTGKLCDGLGSTGWT